MDNFDEREFGEARRSKALRKAACISREVEDTERGCALLRIRRRSNATSLEFADDEIRRELTRVEYSSAFDKSTNVQDRCDAGRSASGYTPQNRAHPLIRGSEARIIRTGRHTGFVGDVPVPRLGGKLVSGESMLELDFVILTSAFEQDFTDIVSQPCTIPIVVGGRQRKWTPDYLIKRKAGHDELCEVKLLSWLYHKDATKRALARERNAAMERAALALNYRYRLLTEDEIRVEPRLINAKLIHRHCGPFVPQEQMVAALSALVRLPVATSLDKLADGVGPRWRRHILGMAIRLEQAGHIRIDRRTRYCRTSCFRQLTLAGEESAA